MKIPTQIWIFCVGIFLQHYTFLQKRTFCILCEKFFHFVRKATDGEGGTAEEYIMLSLRLKKGLDTEEYAKKYGTPLPQSFFKKTDLYVKNGFMEHNGTSFSFTPKGFLVSNTILADLI